MTMATKNSVSVGFDAEEFKDVREISKSLGLKSSQFCKMAVINSIRRHKRELLTQTA